MSACPVCRTGAHSPPEIASFSFPVSSPELHVRAAGWRDAALLPSVHPSVSPCLDDLDCELWDILPPYSVQPLCMVLQQSKQYHWVDNMVGGWVPERSRRRRTRRGGKMLLEGAVAIGNLDQCQERGVNHLHVFKSCMNNSL